MSAGGRSALSRRTTTRRTRQGYEACRRPDDRADWVDHEAYEGATTLLTAERRISSIAEQTQERAKAADAARRAAISAEQVLVAATSALNEIEVARQHLEEAARLERQVERMEIADGELHAEILEVDADRRRIERRANATDSLGRLERLSLTGGLRRLRRELEALVGKLGNLTARERDTTNKAERYRGLLEPEIAEHRRQAEPIDADEVERRESALKAAQRAKNQAMDVVASAEKALDRARLDLLAAESGPRPTPEHRQLVAVAERERWPQQHAELAILRQQAQKAAPEMVRLERQHEQLVEELERLGRGAEKMIIREARLIATTLAKFRLNPIVYEGPYDAVLVDEVGAATVPEVLLAVAKAAETAPLFGDFLQLGAVTDEAVRKLDNADVRQWLLRDCFSLCGIEDPSDAETSAKQGRGCIVLRGQYRFGIDLMDLANRLTYAGNLRSERHFPSRDDDDPEIVLLDTDGLDDLANIRRTKRVAGWWPAGTLLARILAQQHLEENATVGIITPYGPQAQASLEALRHVEGTSSKWPRTRAPHTASRAASSTTSSSTWSRTALQTAGWPKPIRRATPGSEKASDCSTSRRPELDAGSTSSAADPRSTPRREAIRAHHSRWCVS
jgi:hypothetical protein